MPGLGKILAKLNLNLQMICGLWVRRPISPYAHLIPPSHSSSLHAWKLYWFLTWNVSIKPICKLFCHDDTLSYRKKIKMVLMSVGFDLIQMRPFRFISLELYKKLSQRQSALWPTLSKPFVPSLKTNCLRLFITRIWFMGSETHRIPNVRFWLSHPKFS